MQKTIGRKVYRFGKYLVTVTAPCNKNDISLTYSEEYTLTLAQSAIRHFLNAMALTIIFVFLTNTTAILSSAVFISYFGMLIVKRIATWVAIEAQKYTKREKIVIDEFNREERRWRPW